MAVDHVLAWADVAFFLKTCTSIAGEPQRKNPSQQIASVVNQS